jgi:molybdenum cofactor cytidylyltransferase
VAQRPARIVGVLLAAGRGTRFDPRGERLKLLEPATLGPHRGTPLAAAAARTLHGAVDAVTAVVGTPDNPQQLKLHELLAAEGCALVINAQAADGQGMSIACGVAASDSADGWVIALADMPAIAPSTVDAVAQALRGGALTVAPYFRGQRGHPVGFAAVLRSELLSLTGDTGARSILARHRPQRVDVDDAGVLYDVDTRQDIE